jgi:6-phosphogluconolactonase
VTLAITLLLSSSMLLASGGESLIYVGTYTTDAKAKGIYAYRFQPATGTVTPLGLVAETPSPAFLAVHPNRRFLYAANEHDGDDRPGHDNTVSAFAIDRKTGKLTLLNQTSSRGEGPAHLAVDRTGKAVLVGNYRSGSVALLPIRKDGKLDEASAFDQHHGSSVKPRQEGPHAHGVAFSPDNRFAVVAEHGIDQVMSYRFDAGKGSLKPNDPPFWKAAPGHAPRHLVFHPLGQYLYVLNELGSAVTVLSYEGGDGTMAELQMVSTLPPGFADTNTTAEIQVDRTGRFLYASNRGHDSIAVFAIDPAWGMLTFVEHVSTGGKRPRNFSLDPTGGYLFAANQDSDNIVIFRVDPRSGRLTPTGQTIETPTPVCIQFVAAR